MIRIIRTNCPKLLSGSPIEGKTYRAESVVNALHEMQHGKCCYCEGELPKTGSRKTVEHFRPKERDEFKMLRNDWKNLLLACPDCNENKGNKFPVDNDNQPLIIDPTDTSVNPEEHLEFIVSSESDFLLGLVIARDNSMLGRETIDTLKLYSKFLTVNRVEFVRQLEGYYRDMIMAIHRNDSDAAEYARTQLINCTEPTKRFSACAKEYIKKMKINEKYNKWLNTRDDD